MSRLVAIACSAPQVAPLAMEALDPFLSGAPTTGDHGSGMGSFGPDGQPLVSRRPADGGRRDEDIRKALAGGFVIQQYTRTLAGPFRAEDSPPYRFHKWIGAVADGIDPETAPSDPVLAVPPHVARNIRGRRAAEQVFHLFLGFMHSFRNLETTAPNPTVTCKAIDAALSLIPGRWGADGGALFACDGRVLVAGGRGWPLWFATLGDMTDANIRFDATTRLPLRSGPPRAVIVTDLPTTAPGWQPVPDRGYLIVDRAGRWELVPPAHA